MLAGRELENAHVKPTNECMQAAMDMFVALWWLNG